MDGLVAGEERFSVMYEGNGGNVYFDVLSFSRGAYPLARVIMPFIRPLQVSHQSCFSWMVY